MIEFVRLFRSQMEAETLGIILSIRSAGVLVEDPDTLNRLFVAKNSERDIFSQDFYKCLAVGVSVVGTRVKYLAHVIPSALRAGVDKSFEKSMQAFRDRFSGSEFNSFVAGGTTPLIDIPSDDYNRSSQNLVRSMKVLNLNPVVIEPFMIPPTEVYWGEKLYVVGDGVKPRQQ